MDAQTLILFILGVPVLIVGAESLVAGASRLASRMGVSPLLIGLTVVAYGTGAPELAVSLLASLRGEPDLALGNVVGSNICNVLLILGIAAVILPLRVNLQLLRIDVPLMILVSAAVLLMALDGAIGRGEGELLLLGMVGYTVLAIQLGRWAQAREAPGYEREFSRQKLRPGGSILLYLGLILVGLVLLVLGSRWLVDGAVALARYIGVSELTIGLTIVAMGTSLPEIATTVLAAIRGERDIAVGNVVGSCIFNLACVLGIVATAARPQGVSVAAEALRFDLPLMVVVAGVCLPFFAGAVLTRWRGLLLLAYYAVYVVAQWLSAQRHPDAPLVRQATLWCAALLVILAAAPSTVLALARRSAPNNPENAD